MNELAAKDIEMSKGYAIVTMLLLHLFCIPWGDVLYKPFIWVNKNNPLIYYIGWLCAICAPIFCLCNGYAHYRQGEQNGLTRSKRVKRLLKFMITFWTACSFVALIGITMHSDQIPGNIYRFAANMLLLDWSYTGIWWYAFVYVFLVLISNNVYKAVKRFPTMPLMLLMTLQFIIVELLWKKSPDIISVNMFAKYLVTRLYYMFGARLFCYTAGMYIARFNIVSFVDSKLQCLKKWKNIILIILLSVSSALLIIINRGILLIPYSFPVFIAFNCWKKGVYLTKLFSFLGRHSTYVWLIHPIIYSGVIPKFSIWLGMLQYPILVFLVLLLICIIISRMLELLSNRIIGQLVR